MHKQLCNYMLSPERGFVPFLSVIYHQQIELSATGKEHQSCVASFINGSLPACFLFHMRKSQAKK